MVKKKRERVAGDVDSVLHISTKRTKPNYREGVNIPSIIKHIYTSYNYTENSNNVLQSLSDFVILQSCSEASTLYKQLDIIQKFKRRVQKWGGVQKKKMYWLVVLIFYSLVLDVRREGFGVFFCDV